MCCAMPWLRCAGSSSNGSDDEEQSEPDPAPAWLVRLVKASADQREEQTDRAVASFFENLIDEATELVRNCLALLPCHICACVVRREFVMLG